VLNDSRQYRTKFATESAPPVDGNNGITNVLQNSSVDVARVGSNGWVSKRDRHMQLINASVYERDADKRIKAIEQTRLSKTVERNAIEIKKVGDHLGFSAYSSSASGQHNLEVEIEGVVFQVSHGGSKLVRSKGFPTSTCYTDCLADLERRGRDYSPPNTKVSNVKWCSLLPQQERKPISRRIAKNNEVGGLSCSIASREYGI
jgi:hypothetical protein